VTKLYELGNVTDFNQQNVAGSVAGSKNDQKVEWNETTALVLFVTFLHVQ